MSKKLNLKNDKIAYFYQPFRPTKINIFTDKLFLSIFREFVENFFPANDSFKWDRESFCANFSFALHLTNSVFLRNLSFSAIHWHCRWRKENFIVTIFIFVTCSYVTIYRERMDIFIKINCSQYNKFPIINFWLNFKPMNGNEWSWSLKIQKNKKIKIKNNFHIENLFYTFCIFLFSYLQTTIFATIHRSNTRL